ncbi:TOBE domain-containing protein [Hydrogenimonas urashimensis]|uniref:TOBE domain-containing protein n=1 Tax=Hydrogenimonas urashimensis TaxID=2740515 RepID=UPI00191558E8|nr:TOBE domain-containing protein [Hydrogenimonas urashimensis]
MNRIHARVLQAHLHEGVSCVTFDASGERLTMIALELPEGIEPGREVELGVKATHVALAKELHPDVAISNQIPVTVEKVTEGTLLVSLRVRFADTTIESIVPKSALTDPAYATGDTAFALFQASELSILKVL